MVGATQTGRQGLGWTTNKWWSSLKDKERRGLVTQEIREAEEEKRLAIAVGQSKQGAWTRWESVNVECTVANGNAPYLISVQVNLRSFSNSSQLRCLG